MGIENTDALTGDDELGTEQQERPESREERIDRAVRDDSGDDLDPEEQRRAAVRADSQRQQGVHTEQANVDGAHNEYEQPESDDTDNS